MNRFAVATLMILPALVVTGMSSPGTSASSSSAAPREPGPAQSIAVKHTLTLEGANRVLTAAIAEARNRSAGGAIAVVDDGGNLVAFARLDGTFAAGAAVSIGKARTAAMFKKPTKAFEDSIKDGRTALVAVAEMVPLQGGVPIEHEGHIVGAIGVSGAHSQVEDEQIALAGAVAVGPSSTATAK